MVYSYNGFDVKNLTIPRENITVGGLVTMTSAGRVRDAYPNEKFMGVCVKAHQDEAVIQVSGYVEVPYEGGHIFTGFQKLVAGDEGKVALYDAESDPMGAGAREYLVLTQNSSKKIIGLML